MESELFAYTYDNLQYLVSVSELIKTWTKHKMLKKTNQTKSLSLSTEQMNKQHPKRSMQTLSRDVVILAMDSQQSGHKDNGKLEKAHLFSFASFSPMATKHAGKTVNNR